MSGGGKYKYGTFAYKRIGYTAHRIAYCIVNGIEPDGIRREKEHHKNVMHVTQTCKNLICCNPNHLKLVSAGEGMAIANVGHTRTQGVKNSPQKAFDAKRRKRGKMT